MDFSVEKTVFTGKGEGVETNSTIYSGFKIGGGTQYKKTLEDVFLDRKEND